MSTETIEQWRPISYAPLTGRYDVSDYGRVRGLCYNGGLRMVPKLLKPKRIKSGHALYDLKDANRKNHSFLGGRLVLLTFVGPPPEPHLEASHLDGNSGNDFVGNLVWETHAENEQRKVGHGTVVRGEKSPQAKLTDVQVLDFRYRHLLQGEPVKSLAIEVGLSPATVHNAVLGKTWRHVPMPKIRRDDTEGGS